MKAMTNPSFRVRALLFCEAAPVSDPSDLKHINALPLRSASDPHDNPHASGGHTPYD